MVPRTLPPSNFLPHVFRPLSTIYICRAHSPRAQASLSRDYSLAQTREALRTLTHLTATHGAQSPSVIAERATSCATAVSERNQMAAVTPYQLRHGRFGAQSDGSGHSLSAAPRPFRSAIRWQPSLPSDAQLPLFLLPVLFQMLLHSSPPILTCPSSCRLCSCLPSRARPSPA